MGYIGTEAVARLAPDIFERFKDRALVEFHALPTEPPILLISAQYLGVPVSPDDMTFLCSLAVEAGFKVEQGYTLEETLIVEVSMSACQERPQTGIVLPFRRREPGHSRHIDL